jgi:hypothetical protein
MRRWTAVHTFSSVTFQEVSPVCGRAADIAASIPHWWGHLKGEGKAVNIGADEFVRWRGVRAGEMSGREPTFYLVYFWANGGPLRQARAFDSLRSLRMTRSTSSLARLRSGQA